MTIPWWSVKTTGTELEHLRAVLESGYLNEGEVTSQFEFAITTRLNSNFAVSSTSGTTALYLALKALGIGRGDKVAVPNLTFIATATAVQLTGAEVELIDVNPQSMVMSEEGVEEAFSRGIRNFVPVHVSGRSAWSPALFRILDYPDVTIIEDAAEALFSKDPVSGKYLGTIGHAGIFSFSPNKIITTGQGGMLVTNLEEVAINAKRLKDQGRPQRGTGGADIHNYEGYNFKFTNLQAAVGIAQIEAIDTRSDFLSKLYDKYRAEINDCIHLRLLNFDTRKGEFPLWPEICSTNRTHLQSKFNALKIGYRNIWLPVNTQNCFLDNRDFPNSKYLSDNSMWIPSSFDLTDKDIEIITETIRCEECQ